ncbi:C2H2-type zinc finger transcription factor [Phycomyces blakesleeanus NRRL 1555(-)]|uniref:C2H2-type zinc finger transcription factor n=1 Tax=Phycomyces blakesleeanus (strain ATCC 8743b / DSM 1359 / FGSC 10004 / NBRC 33097 / NRRL 1555) TaxID=763407 RepID=A0A167K8E1_PHYB8|nr:C2H2-type zinc finger transcription factor [Phycomyces blakesleeanus NRRL 1555(-)]OAD67476.1 C2H2-type zinc finger transcription factor [Phycomyces blakesleeanus NRRL 1555(-)]|eukprot:XP_018285516.1 C2H2-type zinc finger transcription factor [Phycomyces blakesleeanus NRRL 1555(-)]
MPSQANILLRQQPKYQKQEQQVEEALHRLPSPPTSSCGDDPLTNTRDISDSRRGSLPTHFNVMTLQRFSTSLPENYTIDHSLAKSRPEPLEKTLVSTPTNTTNTTGIKIRQRRPSEGYRKARLSAEPKNYQAHRCDACGKVYKHLNCLVKHRWEHSDEWELTSKFLLTKHQQVQMLEAAAILVSMDNSSYSPFKDS